MVCPINWSSPKLPSSSLASVGSRVFSRKEGASKEGSHMMEEAPTPIR